MKKIELLHDDWITKPFWLLMSCYFWDRDREESIRVLRLMYAKWPRPVDIERASRKHMEEHVRCAGLRSAAVNSMKQLGFWFDTDEDMCRMSAEFLERTMKGSPYMVEAWRLFVEKNLETVPTFPTLRQYHAQLLRQRDLPNG
jgi:hypothetical protein